MKVQCHESRTCHWRYRKRRRGGDRSVAQFAKARRRGSRTDPQSGRGRLTAQVDVVRGDLTLPETLDGVTSTVADVTRVPPRTFLDWAHTHAAQFQS